MRKKFTLVKWMSSNIPQEVYAALKEFGLTDYETRAFIALITTGISSAKELSDRTKIPYSRIYDVLVNLENIGWVKVISGRPMKYKAERPAYVAKLAKKQIEAYRHRAVFLSGCEFYAHCRGEQYLF